MSPFQNLQFSTCFPEKTLLISCVDFFNTREFIENPNVLLSTRFGNTINLKNESELNELAYFIFVEKVKQIVILGHYNCKILEHLGRIRKLEADQNALYHPFKSETDRRRKIWFNVASQVKSLLHLDLIHENHIIVKGLVMDECKQNRLEDVDLTVAF